MALYWRSLYGNPDESSANISWAESEGRSALSMFEVSWGQFSLKAARTYVLLGLIYFRMKRYDPTLRLRKVEGFSNPIFVVVS